MKDLNSSVESLTKKTDRLLKVHESRKQKIGDLVAEQGVLKAEVVSLSEELKRLKEENKVLRMASALKGDSENVGETKRKISQMMREIDRCIAMLND